MEEMQSRADAVKAEAERAAENIVRQARAEAERILSEARRQAAQPDAYRSGDGQSRRNS